MILPILYLYIIDYFILTKLKLNPNLSTYEGEFIDKDEFIVNRPIFNQKYI